MPDKPASATIEPPETRESAEQSPGKLIRSVTFSAAWDKRSDDPYENRGINGVEIHFVLRGPEGAVYFPVMTSWMLPEVDEWHRELAQANPSLNRAVQRALCAPFSLHSPTPREGWERTEKCDFLGVPCWSESSGYTAPDVIWEKMLREGDEAFWKELEEIYVKNLRETIEG